MAKRTKKRATKPAPHKPTKQAVKRTARRIAAPRAVKKQEVKKMAKAKKAPAPPAVPKAVGKSMARAAKALAASPKTRGVTGWKDNKYGYTQASVSCYNCAWYEPADILEPRDGPTQEQVQATQYGWCRGESVEQQNLNLAILDDKPGGWLTTDYNVPPTLNMNEPIVKDATEFWCGMWVRTLNPYLWPPAQAALPPPWSPGGPGVVEEPE